jgi:hypothetical protein
MRYIAILFALLLSFGSIAAANNTSTNETNSTGLSEAIRDLFVFDNQENDTNTTNVTNTTNSSLGNGTINVTTGVRAAVAAEPASVELRVKPPYPKGSHYVFECIATGFAPNTYNWQFGDGEQQPRSTRWNVYHIFRQNGDYTVSCTASDGQTTASDSMTVSVDGPVDEANLYVKAWYPKQNHYVFVCETAGFTPSRYDWFYGDGEKLLDIANGDTYHIYRQVGTYNVECNAESGSNTASDSLQITVNSVMETGQTVAVTNSVGNNTNSSGNNTTR